MDRPHKPSALSPTSTSAASGPQPHVRTEKGLVSATLATGDSVEILLYGATVLSWKSGSGKKENLWLSEKAVLDGGKAVRGGIPVVFPNFGPPPKDHPTSQLPQHGFARTSHWEYLGSSTTESTDSSDSHSVKLDFGLSAAQLTSEARKAWSYQFGLVYSVTLSSGGKLQTMLNVRNEGTEAFEFQMLLHTYWKVEDISRTAITGLAAVTYTDKVLNATQHTQSTPTLAITSEVDRVYPSIPQSTTSITSTSDQKSLLDITRDNLSDTVIWNPWKEKAKAMGDFSPDDGYKTLVCVEVGAVQGWTKLEGGETWEGGQIVKSHL